MRIGKFEISNIGRISYAKGDVGKNQVVLVCGANDNGKSSLMRALLALLMDRRALPNYPLNRDAKVKKGFIEAQIIGNDGKPLLDASLVIEWRPNRKGDNTRFEKLVVKFPDGSRPKDPRSSLKRFFMAPVNPDFDLAKFVSATDTERGPLLRKGLGLDTFEIDEQIAAIKEGPLRDANRDVARIQTELNALTFNEDLPKKEPNASQLVKQRDKILKIVDDLHDSISNVRVLKQSGENYLGAVEKCSVDYPTSAFEKLAKAINLWGKELDGVVLRLDDRLINQDAKAKALSKEISSVAEISERFRENERFETVQAELEKRRREQKETEERVKALVAKRAKKLQGNLPIEGLSFDDDGKPLFNGLPLGAHASSSQILFDLGIQTALLNNPQGFIFAENASLIGQQKRDVMRDSIKKFPNAQLWLETVDVPSDAVIIIKDGKTV